MSTFQDIAMPASVDTERAVLGSILLTPELLDEAGLLERDAFTLDSHRRIFLRMRKIASAGQKIDIVTLAESLHETKEVAAVGGVAYLSSLTEGLPRRMHIDEYVSILRKQWMRRQIVKVGTKYASLAADQGEENPADLIASADKELLAIAAENHQEWPSIEHQTISALKRLESQRNGDEITGYEYGIGALDHLIGGLVPKEMTVLGGRPAQGKSSLIAQLAARHCPRQVPMHVFSFEMTSDQLLRRIWSIVSRIPFHKIRHPERLSPDELRFVNQVALRVKGWPLVIDDTSCLTADQLVARARISKRRHGTRIVAIDYLQKMRFSDKPQSRYHEVTSAAVSMAGLAKDEDLALLLLSSVSEKAGKGRNDPPTLQDFRQSGDIGYEASTALLIHREIDDETEKPLENGQIIVAKARSDETGVVDVHFDTNSLTFEERAGVRR